MTFFSTSPAITPLASRFPIAVLLVSVIGVSTISDASIVLGIAVGIILAIFFRIYGIIRPTYFRISPGHLEILRGWPWNDRIARVAVYTLYDKRIHVDLDGGLLVLIDKEENLRLIGIMGVQCNDEMLQPIFEAASCGEVPLQTDPHRLVG